MGLSTNHLSPLCLQDKAMESDAEGNTGWMAPVVSTDIGLNWQTYWGFQESMKPKGHLKHWLHSPAQYFTGFGLGHGSTEMEAWWSLFHYGPTFSSNGYDTSYSINPDYLSIHKPKTEMEQNTSNDSVVKNGLLIYKNNTVNLFLFTSLYCRRVYSSTYHVSRIYTFKGSQFLLM